MLNFVASYPKSGNTWIRLVCTAYALGAEDALDVRYDDVSTLDVQPVSPRPVPDMSLQEEVMVRPASMLMLRRRVQEQTLVKSHHASMQVNDQHLWSANFTERVVNPVRDPRDVCCSAAEHFGMTLEETVEFMAEENATIGGDDKLHHLLGTWSQHVQSWLNHDRVPVHTVKYEDLHADTYGEFEAILEFLGVEEVDEEKLEDAIEACRFDRLQEVEERVGFPEKSDHADKFFRRGETDGWKDELDDELVQQIEEDHADIMEEMGYL